MQNFSELSSLKQWGALAGAAVLLTCAVYFTEFKSQQEANASAQQALDAKLREIAILRTAKVSRSGYEWTQHVVIAKRSGLNDEEIARIKKGADAGWSAADAALIRASDELHKDQFVTDATWAELGKHFDQKQCMDVVFTAGQYTQVSMFLNTFGVQLDAGQTLDPDLKGF